MQPCHLGPACCEGSCWPGLPAAGLLLPLDACRACNPSLGLCLCPCLPQQQPILSLALPVCCCGAHVHALSRHPRRRSLAMPSCWQAQTCAPCTPARLGRAFRFLTSGLVALAQPRPSLLLCVCSPCVCGEGSEAWAEGTHADPGTALLAQSGPVAGLHHCIPKPCTCQTESVAALARLLSQSFMSPVGLQSLNPVGGLHDSLSTHRLS